MSTVDKYPLPVPEKKQRKARLRRMRQQRRDGQLNSYEFREAMARFKKECK